MGTRILTSPLVVRDNRGEERLLMSYSEPRLDDRASGAGEWLRWARDEAGRWYSFGRDEGALIESLSGAWFTVVA